MTTVHALTQNPFAVVTNWEHSWSGYALKVHADNVAKGFWPADGRNFGEIVALMHSEIAEAWEGWNVSPRKKDEKCPEYLNVYVEVADCAIRLLDMLGVYHSTMLDDLNVDDYIDPVYDELHPNSADFTVSYFRGMAENLRTIDSYLARALEADRKGKDDERLDALEDAFMSCIALLKCHKQDAKAIIDTKLAYNRSRPYKHGKAFG